MIAFIVSALSLVPERPNSFGAFADAVTRAVEGCAADGARLALFPEYTGMILGGLSGGSPLEQARGVQQYLDDYLSLHSGLARLHGMSIVAGSILVETENGAFVNRAHLFNPDGTPAHQDKLHLTRYEKELGFVQPGISQRVFETSVGSVGILICYDAEFPGPARRLSLDGAKLLLIPSCTDTRAGAARVRIAARARALENQCYVLCSPTSGRSNWSDYLDFNTGRPGLYGPPDVGFPDDGVIAESTEGDRLTAVLNFVLVDEVRKSGAVFLFNELNF